MQTTWRPARSCSRSRPLRRAHPLRDWIARRSDSQIRARKQRRLLILASGAPFQEQVDNQRESDRGNAKVELRGWREVLDRAGRAEHAEREHIHDEDDERDEPGAKRRRRRGGHSRRLYRARSSGGKPQRRIPTPETALAIQDRRTTMRRLPTGKERRENNNTMKYLTIIALAAAALALGGCAKDEPSHSTHATQSSSTTGYGK